LRHRPVLLKETLDLLNLQPGAVVVDGTIGSGGHAREILKRLGRDGRLIGVDRDLQAIERCRRTLPHSQVTFCHDRFDRLPEILDSLNLPAVDAVLLDIGMSSDQLEDAERGFSFERCGPLDMRMDKEESLTAGMIVNQATEKELAEIFWNFGEERWARRFARSICAQRGKGPITTTEELADIIRRSVPGRAHSRGRRKGRPRHPATRVFQALRIAVNNEINILKEALPRIWERIRPGGRLAVISFHSLEDRVVKQNFRAWAKDRAARLITPKPLAPSEEEILDNPRARSAKLRVAEKTR
jgi:16S rRNA (cytosine1402-N4)-methyltransferase